MQKRKIAALLIAGALSALVFSACNPSQPEVNARGAVMLCAQETQYTLTSGQSVEIPLDKDIEDKNYFFMNLQTNVNLVGHIHYENNGQHEKTNTEKFFIEAGSEEFTCFLDAFRLGARGIFDKIVTKITLQNVSTKAGNVLLESAGVTDRTYDRNQEIYIQDGHLKMGTSLGMGGALRHMEKLNANVVEYIDSAGHVRIEPNIDKEKVELITDEVNFVNIHDLGREIQQSYYSAVGEENGYAPTEPVLYDADLRYNPVQAGSAGGMQSQIIDFHYTETEIYVKVRPLEWFFLNVLSDSYMENIYTLKDDGTLRVVNRFVNFSQFTDMEKTEVYTQELPAVYIAQPLNYFYCETTEGVIFDPNLSPLPTTPGKTSLSHNVGSNYHYSLVQDQVVNDWVAFVNENKFGIGIYVPNAGIYSASRGCTTTEYSMFDNQSYDKKYHNLYGREYIPSAYVTNYNYLSPASVLIMQDFVPLEYEYVICIGTTEEMGAAFKRIAKNEKIFNHGLDAWK